VQIIEAIAAGDFTLNNEIQPDPSDPIPLIISIDSEITVGSYYTILGVNFGSQQGTLTIKIEDNGTVVTPTILRWSNTSIQFTIPENTGRIPFNARGRLTVKVAKSVPEINRIFNQASAYVTVIPMARLYFAYFDESHKGSNWDIINYSDYREEMNHFSPRLPEVWMRHDAEIMDAVGITLDFIKNLRDSPALIEFVASGQSLFYVDPPEGEKMWVTFIVKDGRQWNYTVRSQFFIVVPNGYTIYPGWHRQQ